MRNFFKSLGSKSIGSQATISRLPAIIYIVFLVVLFIFNSFSTQRAQRAEIIAKREIESLTVTSTIVHAELVTYQKESNILDQIIKRQVPLLESETPPLTFKPE